MDKRIASGESARRYYSTKEFIFNGVPSVFKPKIPKSDFRFFDPSNTWYVYDNKPLKESLEKFAKFPISTSFDNNEPRLLLIAVDVQECVPVVFDSYEKEDGTRKTECFTPDQLSQTLSLFHGFTHSLTQSLSFLYGDVFIECWLIPICNIGIDSTGTLWRTEAIILFFGILVNRYLIQIEFLNLYQVF